MLDGINAVLNRVLFQSGAKEKPRLEEDVSPAQAKRTPHTLRPYSDSL